MHLDIRKTFDKQRRADEGEHRKTLIQWLLNECLGADQ